MSKKATLSTMEKMQRQLDEPEIKESKPKKKSIETVIEKQILRDSGFDKKARLLKPKSKQIPRGERGDFLKTTLTLPAEMLAELRALGMRRKAAKMKDTDTSALVREALTDFLNKHRI